MKIKYLAFLTLALALLASACGKSDADLQTAVTEKLATDKVTGVTVTVKDGVATLTGEVADAAAKNKAEASAKVEGITSVDSKLTVKPPPPPSPPPVDPALKGKVEENLKKAGCTGVTIEVVAGKVVAKGKVPAAKYLECVQVIQQAGATGFDNQIEKGS